MAVSSACEIWEGRDASADIRGEITFTRVFRVITDTYTDDGNVAGSAAIVPRVGDSFPGFPFVYCRQVVPRNESSDPRVWIVTCSYTNERSPSIQQDPNADAAIITWNSEQFQRDLLFDKDNNAVANSAGDAFEPPPTRDESRLTATLRKNLIVIPTWILQYPDAVNESAFTLDGVPVAARVAKVQKIGVSEPKQRNNITYRELTIDFHFKQETWDVSIWDLGFNAKDPLDPNLSKKRILLKDGSPKPTPSYLVNGFKASIDEPSPASIRTFRVYTELDFSVLPLT